MDGETSYTASYSANPNILGLVILSAAFGVAISRSNYWFFSTIPSTVRVGEEAKPVLSLVTSISGLTSHIMDWGLKWLCPPGLLSLVATQVFLQSVICKY